MTRFEFRLVYRRARLDVRGVFFGRESFVNVARGDCARLVPGSPSLLRKAHALYLAASARLRREGKRATALEMLETAATLRAQLRGRGL